jgi:hypothetical protein
MPWPVLLACALLIMSSASSAAAQSRVGNKSCSVDKVDTVRYGTGAIYRDCEVDRAAKLRKDVQPEFEIPRRLSCVNVELEFVVDSAGLVVDSTALVLSSNDTDFALVIRRSLKRWRYEPATKNGIAVRQVVRKRVERSNGSNGLLTVEKIASSDIPVRSGIVAPCS